MPDEKSPPFPQKSKGYKQMVAMLEEGTISPDMSPRDAYASDPLFLRYSSTVFEAQLHNWRKANGYYDLNPAKATPQVEHKGK